MPARAHPGCMFDAIVVPLDGTDYSAAAVDPAVTLASQTGARLAFVSCAPTVGVEERTDYLKGIARATFLPNETEVVMDGPVADGIIRFATKRAPSLLCMTSHARGLMGQAVFGHTVADVIRRLGQAVLVVGPRCVPAANYSEVIVAVDASDESAAILPSACALAGRLNAKLHLVEVIDPADLRAAAAAGVPASDLQEAGHVGRLATRLADDGVTVGWEVLHNDNAARGILDHLREHPDAIVAMATHARTGLTLLAEGSVANDVVHFSTVPVLLLH